MEEGCKAAGNKNTLQGVGLEVFPAALIRSLACVVDKRLRGARIWV